MLSEDFLYQLKQNNTIEAVMSSYVNLNRRGHNYVCLCPFHSEKSPSCTVYPDTDSFFCFGCGAGGDVVTFIRKIENLEYIEAVKFLAERSGIALPEDAQNNQLSQIKARTLEINRLTARFFYTQLSSKGGEKGLRYLAARGLSPETIKKYGLGYAVDSWDNLKKYMLSQGFSEDELVTAAVCFRTQKGNVIDAFRDRVMFPIIDLRGNVIAFGGRVIDGDGPKYLNSSDTPVFKKSRNLFSLNFAKNSKLDKLILAEGYMDVISINQAGFENVVATLGTALTPEQARLMSQYSKEIIIAYDSDGPGQAATHKAINLLGDAGVNTKIIKMDGAKDPDEYIKKYGAVRFKLLLDNSDGAIAFELAKCKNGLDITTDVGKVDFLKRAVKVLADISSPIERDVYISRIASDQGISKEVIRAQVSGIIKNKINTDKKHEWTSITSTYTIRDKINPEATSFPRENRAERGIISYLFNHPDNLDYITSKLPADKFLTSFNKKVYEKLIEGIKNSLEFSFSSLGNEFTVDEMGRISEILAKSREISISEKEIDDYIDVLLSHKIIVYTPIEVSDEDFKKSIDKIAQEKLKYKKS